MDKVLAGQVDAVPQCSSSRHLRRLSTRPSLGIDRLALWFPTASSHQWFDIDIPHPGSLDAKVHVMARGGEAGIELNPSRIVHPGSIKLATLAETLEVAREAWAAASSSVRPITDFEMARVTRLDLTRDFAGALEPAKLIAGMALVPRTHGGDPVVRYDARTHGAKSLTVGSKSRRLILYDKALEAPDLADPGAVRWELQAHTRWLRKFDIDLAADLVQETVQQLIDTQWRWSRMETPITSTSDLFEFIVAAGVPPGQQAGLAWSIQQVRHGCELSDYNRRKFDKFVGQFGMPVELEVAPVEASGSMTERLDWNTGTVVTTVGSDS